MPTVVYDRNVLYEQVWAKPMRDVAKTYGVSDRALTKTCRKLNVPLPGVGYWNKLYAGHKLKQPPLPALKPGEKATLEVDRWRPLGSARTVGEGDKKKLEKEREPEAAIVVPDELIDPHELVRMSMPILRRAARGEAVKAQACLDIDVEKDSLNRALRIMDALFKALVARGYTVEVTDPIRRPADQYRDWRHQPGEQVVDPSETRVLIKKQWITFGIVEGFDVVPKPEKQHEVKHRLHMQEVFGRFGYAGRPPTTRVSNGKLAFSIKTTTWENLRRSWKDAKHQRLDKVLNAVVQGLIIVGHHLHKRQVEEERERRCEERERRRKAEDARRQRREQRLRRDLQSRIDHWLDADAARRIVAAMKKRARKRRASTAPSSELGEWLAWATKRIAAMTASALQPPPLLSDADDGDEEGEEEGDDAAFD